MSGGSLVVLSDRQMAGLIDWPAAIAATETACRHFSAGLARSPTRLRVPLAEGRRFAVMPAFDTVTGALGTKLVGYYPDNPARALSRVSGVYAFFDSVTGLPLALMEGAYLTNLRTAAVAVVAARALAVPGGRRLGIIGSGGLATMSAEAFLAAAPPHEIRLFSRTPANLARFAERLRGRVEVLACTSPEEVARDSDVLVCGTDTHTPLFDGRVLGSGRLVISLGANTPTTRELDATTMCAGPIIADSRPAVLAECGEIIIAQSEGLLPADPIAAELGDVLDGKHPGRTAAGETIVFLSTGLAVQDVLTAELIYKRAIERGIGTRATLFE